MRLQTQLDLEVPYTTPQQDVSEQAPRRVFQIRCPVNDLRSPFGFWRVQVSRCRSISVMPVSCAATPPEDVGPVQWL